MTSGGGSSSSSAASSSSDSSSDDSNAMKASSQSPPKLLLNDGDSDDDDDENVALKSASGFNINTKFAREYEQRKRREELTKHRKVNFDLDEDDVDGNEDDSSSSESEDEEGELLTPQLDAQIVKTLKALRRKDESVYDKNATFYANSNDSDDDESSGGKKMKRKTYKDVVREQILEQMDDEDGYAHGRKKDVDGASGDLAYDEEQRDIRRAFLESTRDNVNDDNEGGSDDDDNWIKPKTKSKTSSKEDQDADDDEARKLWEQELQEIAAASAAPDISKKGLVDPHGDVQDGDQFLMEFMTHKKWLENGTSRFNLDKDDDDDQSLEDLERMDEFESKYNFRFEEAAAAADNTDPMTSGASHSIVQYARGSNAENVLRRKDESRRQKRLARKERKAEERKAKEEQLRRLKNARREELDERMKQVRNVLGSEDGLAALGGAEEEMILKLMEGDYNPEKFEQVMNSVYGDEYYEKEDEAWKNDQDVKRDLASGKEDSDVLGDGEMYDEENADDDFDDDVGDEDYDEDAYEGETPLETAEEKTELSKKMKDKMMDELYKLDYEDIIGDMPTRFKYRTVEKNSFGLSTEEILFAKDSTLKQFVSLKKMATYNEEEYQPGTKKRKRFRQMLKAEKEEMKDEHSAVDVHVAASAEGDGEKKKKRRRQKKGSKKSSEDTPVANEVAKVTDVVPEEKAQQQSEQKHQQRRKKKGQSKDDQTKDIKLESNVDVIETREDVSGDRLERKKAKKNKSKAKDGSKKYSDGGKKKKHLSKVDGVSSARLAAYGF